MHALVELPKRVGDDRDMAHGGLLAEPLGKVRYLDEEFGIGYAARVGRLQRVIEHGIAAQVLVHEIGVAPELDAFVEEMDQYVVEFVARNGHDHRDHHHRPSPQQRLSAPQRKVRHGTEQRPHQAPVRTGTDREQRKHGRQECDGEKKGHADPESDEVAEVAVGGHLREVHAQESERRREAGQEHRVQVETDGMDDGIALRVPGAHVLLQCHQQVNAVGHDNHQHDGRRRRDGRGKRQAGPTAQADRRENGKDDHRPGRRHPRNAADEDPQDQGHKRKAGGQEDHLALDRCFQEGLVDHDRADHAKVHAGKLFFGLCGDLASEACDFGDRLQLVPVGQFHRYVHHAHVAAGRQDAALDTGIGQRDRAYA